MIVPKVSRVLPVRAFPASLFHLLQPGKSFTAKVETIEGRLLSLSVGGERLEALLDEKIPQGQIRPGQNLRLKVLSNGQPVILSLDWNATRELPGKEKVLRLLRSFILTTPSSPSPPSSSQALGPEALPPERLLVNFLQRLLAEQTNDSPGKPPASPEGTPQAKGSAQAPESRPIPEAARQLLDEAAESRDSRASMLPRPDDTSVEAKQRLETSPKPEHLRQELREGLLKLWQEGIFILPFAFGDRISWGYLYEEEGSRKRPQGERTFTLQLFLSRLGFLEARFRLLSGRLNLELYFAREDALTEARQSLPELQDSLFNLGLTPKVSLHALASLPGTFLDIKN